MARWTRRKQRKVKPDDLLSDIYYGYGKEGALKNTPEYLYRLARKRLPTITRDDVKLFLTKQPSYTVHRRQARLRYPHRKIRITAPGIRVDADLVDLQDLAPWNDGFKYALIAIDAFTRFVWQRPLREKTSSSVTAAFTHLMDRESLACIRLYTDQGTEFLGQPFQQLLKARGIGHHICAGEQFHCPFVERVNRTLKEKLFQAMTAGTTRRWLDLLPQMAATYNKTIHSATGRRPSQVTDANALDVYMKAHGPKKKGRKRPVYRFKRGDYVRIVKLRSPLGHGYLPRFTWEVFRIADRVKQSDREDPPAYFLEDLRGERVTSGIFYESELSRVDPSLVEKGGSAAWPIREIIGKRKAGREVLVWWQGLPRDQAEWIPASRLQKNL